MMKKKKALAMSVLCAVASAGFVMGASAETMHGNLEEIVVEGSADVLPGGFLVANDRVGILGDIKAIDVPFTQNSIPKKLLQPFMILTNR